MVFFLCVGKSSHHQILVPCNKSKVLMYYLAENVPESPQIHLLSSDDVSNRHLNVFVVFLKYTYFHPYNFSLSSDFINSFKHNVTVSLHFQQAVAEQYIPNPI